MCCSSKLDDAHPLPQLLEKSLPKRLRQYVRELLLGAHELNSDVSTIDTLADEMEFSVDVFAPIMEHRILTECNCGLTVHLQSEFLQLLTLQL